LIFIHCKFDHFTSTFKMIADLLLYFQKYTLFFMEVFLAKQTLNLLFKF